MAIDRRWVYLALSLAAPLYFGAVTLHYVFSHPFIVQDDLRQHGVWFQSFLDPTVFQNDAIADYFRSVAPLGVKAVYGLGATLGLDPLRLAALLPLPLALIATGFLYLTTLAIAPVPRAAWLATLVFNQHLWLNDDLVTATPRAFVYPLFAAFLYGWVRRSPLTLVAIALLGLFFPQMMLVAVATVGVSLVDWRRGLALTGDRQRWLMAALSLAIALLVALPFALSLSDYGPAITAAQMRLHPAYGPGGRSEYFGVHPLAFLLHGSSGVRIPVFPSIIWVGFALPLMGRWNKKWGGRSPVLVSITPQVRILADLMGASLGLFLLAHLLLLRLHFPSRYTYHSWRFALSIAAGIVLAAVVTWGLRQWPSHRGPHHQRRRGRGWARKGAIARSLGVWVAIVVVGVPLVPPLMVAFQGWVVGELPAIYTYLQAQPPDTLVASLAPEGNNIPAFAHRSTWVGREFALPHHPQYDALMTERTAALLQAHYSSNPTELTRFINDTGVDVFLVERSAFQPDYLTQDWLLHSRLSSQVKAIQSQLSRGDGGVLASRLDACAVVEENAYVLADAACLSEESLPPRSP